MGAHTGDVVSELRSLYPAQPAHVLSGISGLRRVAPRAAPSADPGQVRKALTSFPSVSGAGPSGLHWFQWRPPGRGLQAAFSSACLLSGCTLSVPFVSAHLQACAAAHHGAVCCSAARSSPTAPTPCTRLQVSSDAPQSAVMVPPSGVARGLGRRGCAAAAAYLPDPSFSSRSFRLRTLPCSCCATSCRRAARPASVSFSPQSPSHVAVSRTRSDAQTAATAPAQAPTECVATPRQLRERARRKKGGATRNGVCGVTFDVVTMQAQVNQFRSFVGPSHGPGHTIAELVMARGFAGAPTWAGIRTHLPHAPAGHPHLVLRIWWWDLNSVWSLLSAVQASSSSS